jgi:hypothetical protein
MSECEGHQRARPDESTPQGPAIPSSGRRDYLKLPDEGDPHPTFSGELFQSPVEINVFAHIPCFIITAQFLENTPAAELTSSLGHAAHESKHAPKLQVRSHEKTAGLMQEIYSTANSHWIRHRSSNPKQ